MTNPTEVEDTQPNEDVIAPRQEIEPGEWEDIANKLDQYHSVFNKFWSLGVPTETREIPTCAVFFDRSGQTINWKVNPDFWATLSDDGKLFAIAHECLHVIFSHGTRWQELAKVHSQEILNTAADIVVNDYLEAHYGFDRKTVQPTGVNYVWLDEVLPGEPSGKTFEYYVAALAAKNPQCQVKQPSGKAQDGAGPAGARGSGGLPGKTPGSPGSKPTILDDHSGLPGFTGKDLADMLENAMDIGAKQETADIAKDDATQQMKQDAAKAAGGLQPGSSPGNSVLAITSTKRIPRKDKWETIIKKWTQKIWELTEDTDGWVMPSRRIDEEYMDKMSLPTPYDDVDLSRHRINVSFFLDTSGSCYHLAERFFNAAASLDPKKFNIDLLNFDTRVYRTSLKERRVYGGGGTSFHILESFLQKECREGKPYPEIIFVITDGYGDTIKPEYPPRWHVFYTEQHSKACFPSECHVHLLADFE